jgi:hypothetical protein
VKRILRSFALLFVTTAFALVLLSFSVQVSIALSPEFGERPYIFLAIRFVLIAFVAGILGFVLLFFSKGQRLWCWIFCIGILAYYVFGVTRLYESVLDLSLLITEPVVSEWGAVLVGVISSTTLFHITIGNNRNKRGQGRFYSIKGARVDCLKP